MRVQGDQVANGFSLPKLIQLEGCRTEEWRSQNACFDEQDRTERKKRRSDRGKKRRSGGGSSPLNHFGCDGCRRVNPNLPGRVRRRGKGREVSRSGVQGEEGWSHRLARFGATRSEAVSIVSEARSTVNKADSLVQDATLKGMEASREGVSIALDKQIEEIKKQEHESFIQKIITGIIGAIMTVVGIAFLASGVGGAIGGMLIAGGVAAIVQSADPTFFQDAVSFVVDKVVGNMVHLSPVASRALKAAIGCCLAVAIMAVCAAAGNPLVGISMGLGFLQASGVVENCEMAKFDAQTGEDLNVQNLSTEQSKNLSDVTMWSSIAIAVASVLLMVGGGAYSIYSSLSAASAVEGAADSAGSLTDSIETSEGAEGEGMTAEGEASEAASVTRVSREGESLESDSEAVAQEAERGAEEDVDQGPEKKTKVDRLRWVKRVVQDHQHRVSSVLMIVNTSLQSLLSIVRGKMMEKVGDASEDAGVARADSQVAGKDVNQVVAFSHRDMLRGSDQEKNLVQSGSFLFSKLQSALSDQSKDIANMG